MISKSNSKIGNIHAWNIPAFHTCPGKTDACVSVCYAGKNRFTTNRVQTLHARNYKASLERSWPTVMLSLIDMMRIKVFRIHASGDMYSAAYVKKWLKIIRGAPDTQFYAYTRSWTVAKIFPLLGELGDLPNMQLWLSGDRDMPTPPRLPDVRRCYLSLDDSDLPAWKADLVFRVRRNTIARRVGRYSSLVCPVEQGIKRAKKITCESCGLCYKEKADNADVATIKLRSAS